MDTHPFIERTNGPEFTVIVRFLTGCLDDGRIGQQKRRLDVILPGEPVALFPKRLGDRLAKPVMAQNVDMRDPKPRHRVGFTRLKSFAQGVGEFLPRPLVLTLAHEVTGHMVHQLGEQLDIERGIVAPIARQRTI